MKLFDKFLKKLNVNRNTFVTYILTLITVYLAVDRIVEMLLMIFTGISDSYWGPLQYTFALACPVFAFLFSGSSSFASSKKEKVTIFYLYLIGLYIISISMFTQWLNLGGWLLFISVPNYAGIVTNFSNLIKPAFCALSLYIPLVTVYPFIKKIVLGVNDSADMIKSIWDYGGINISGSKAEHGPYKCEVCFLYNAENGKKITFSEEKRYQSLFVCGGSGTGKTSLIFEPMMAQDIEKKYFFKEVSKELGYTALKTGIATLNAPYDNEYLNANFSLNMISATSGKEKLFKTFIKKMILATSPEVIFRDIGMTYLSPDYEAISHMISICDNYNVKYNLVDPANSNSLGLNPFIYDNPTKIAVTISSVLKGMYVDSNPDRDDVYKEDVAIQAIENLTILLKEMYPRLNNGALPNLEDLLKLLTNFKLIEKMCEIMAHDEELAEKYAIQISYFKNYFYENAKNKSEVEKYIFTIIAKLDNLLRMPNIKSILCNRKNNINFDDMLKNGEFTFVCTRRGDSGAVTHKAFGLFFLLSMQNAVLRRPGNEKNRVPHFLYIDEYPDFICTDTEAIFTMYRKYCVGTTISAQNLKQLESHSSRTNFRQTILANCGSKIFTGNGTPEDLEWWSKEFGTHREWTYKNNMDMNKLEYDSKYSDVKWSFVTDFKVGKLQSLKFKRCAYKIKADNGKPQVGEGVLSFIGSKYKEKQTVKSFNFTRFTSGISIDNNLSANKFSRNKFNPKKVDFVGENDEIDPIQNNTSNTNIFDNEDAIIVNLKKGKKN